MTKEELEKEAEEWLDKRYLKDMGVRKPCKQAYLAGAEPREKRIAELEAQIEKMKCCSNCNHYNMTYLPYWCDENNSPTYPRQKCDKWEIKENDR